MKQENNEQEFMKQAVVLAKNRNLSTQTVLELLSELKVGDEE